MPRTQSRKLKFRRKHGASSLIRKVSPPLYSYLSSFHTILQICWTMGGLGKPSNNWQATLDPGWILSYSWRQLQNTFNVMKVHSIEARYIPFMSKGAKGDYIFALYDFNTNVEPSFDPKNFDELVGTAGSVVRHGGQSAKLVWKPMEPNDRNWVLTGGSHAFASTWIVAAETAYYDDYLVKMLSTAYIDGKIISNISVSFKGRTQYNNVNEIDPSSCCNKCFKRFSNSRILERLEDLEVKVQQREASVCSEKTIK